MNKRDNEDPQRKKLLKELIKGLHKGEDVDKVKERFKDIIKDTTPEDIAKIEEELINEGMPREEIQRLCDIHLAVFKEELEKEKLSLEEGHPIHILTEEHKLLLGMINNLKKQCEYITKRDSYDEVKDEMTEIEKIIHLLKDSENHYLREENVLFPYLEKHGITQPPAIMWTEHDRIREIKKEIYKIIEECKSGSFQNFVKGLEKKVIELSEILKSHFYKENNILFPTAMKVIIRDEWKEIREQFDEVGYCCFTPIKIGDVKGERQEKSIRREEEGMINLETGNLTIEEVEAIFNSMPVDITFVDSEDTVRYFSQTKERIFTRTKAVIGRKVQQCHPQKSLHIVNRIIDDFKSRKSDKAEFWINLNDRLIYIRYFAVRGKDGRYMGCIEVTQDITNIKNIEGEKRLL
ncbi:MAG: DUF438 domain-containing protein [bacterium]